MILYGHHTLDKHERKIFDNFGQRSPRSDPIDHTPQQEVLPR
jgi:hypothetical protein